ncbi:hypothetical protein OOK60_03950 [Trichothermofontia sichuanensis B231]|nr:hypothetical protein [Trichothermofontia sichuanensis]UZQ55239.1 hypothetical protein OOK60_03950 [Trichothermofontia sichuanensis B231]
MSSLVCVALYALIPTNILRVPRCQRNLSVKLDLIAPVVGDRLTIAFE